MLRFLLFYFLTFPLCLKGLEDASEGGYRWEINDIVRIVLENQKEIAIRYENINVQAGLARQLAAPFDLIPTLEYNRIVNKEFAATKPPPIKVKLSQFDSQMLANLNKTFRWGTIISASAQVNNIRNRLHSRPPSALFGDIAPYPIPNYQLTFTITQPLLKHFINGLDVMNEKAQRLQVSVAFHSAVFFVSDRITNAINLYWEVVAAKKLIEIHQEGVRQYIRFIDQIKGLIKGEQIAVGDIYQPEAQLGQERANLDNAYQIYNQAVQNLKFAMGIGDQCILGCEDNILTEDYPPIQESKFFGDHSCEALMRTVRGLYQNRQDIVALEINEESAELRLIGSKNESLPQLDVYGTYFATRTRQSTKPVKTTFNGYVKDLTVGVVLSQPLGNDLALGLVRQRLAEKHQASLMTKLLKEEMSKNFIQLWKNHFMIIEEIEEAKIAVELYSGLIQNEIVKLNAGFSTIFVIIDFERQLLQAQISLNDAYKNYAQNIVQYRFVSGTLLNLENGLCGELEVEPLTIWPRLVKGSK